MFLQWNLGRRVLQRNGVAPVDSVADALFASACCFVVPDSLLLLSGRADLLALWARVAGPLALMTMLWVLHRRCRSWRVTLWAAFAMAVPALLLVR